MAVNTSIAAQRNRERREANIRACKLKYEPEYCDRDCVDEVLIGYNKLSYWKAEKTYQQVNQCTGVNGNPYTLQGMSDGGVTTIIFGVIAIIVLIFVGIKIMSDY